VTIVLIVVVLIVALLILVVALGEDRPRDAAHVQRCTDW
jgi:hypothetical protein